MNKIYACLPCYNESENIGALIEAWIAQYDAILDKGYELTIVGIDDHSTDDTLNILIDYSGRYPGKIRVLKHKRNLNLGGGVKNAFRFFLKECSSGDLCVLMDGDNTHDPKYIISMIDKISEGADCVIASRYCEKSKIVGVPAFRELLSDGAKLYYMLVLGVKNVRDYTCGYRVYQYDIIRKAADVYGKYFVEKKSFACMMEILYKLYQIGAVFDEVPFTLRYDLKQGQSKMRVLKVTKDSLITAVALRLSVKRGK